MQNKGLNENLDGSSNQIRILNKRVEELEEDILEYKEKVNSKEGGIFSLRQQLTFKAEELGKYETYIDEK